MTVLPSEWQPFALLLTAGLVSSTCVLFTTASAAQNGFLTAVVEDCCADDLAAHVQTLERYPFIFERVTSASLLERRAVWLEQIRKLDEWHPARK